MRSIPKPDNGCENESCSQSWVEITELSNDKWLQHAAMRYYVPILAPFKNSLGRKETGSFTIGTQTVSVKKYQRNLLARDTSHLGASLQYGTEQCTSTCVEAHASL